MILKFILLFCSSLLPTTTCQEIESYEEQEFTANSNFAESVKRLYYIDKTLIVKAFLENNESTSNLVTAPVNFGKTLNIRAIKHFLEIQVYKNGTEISDKTNTTNFELFTDTKIYKEHPDFFETHFGQYPVVYVEYKSLSKIKSLPHMLRKMRTIIADTFRRHAYLLRVDGLWDEDLKKETFREYIDTRQNRTLGLRPMKKSLLFLGRALLKHFKRKPIILIDDYDAYVFGLIYQNVKNEDKIYKFFWSLNQPLVDTDSAIFQRFYGTAILRIVTGYRHAPIELDIEGYTFLQDHIYLPFHGMTEEEFQKLLKSYAEENEFDYEELRDTIRQYYGGYRSRRKKVNLYCISSALQFLENKELRDDNALRSYWDRPNYYLKFLHLFYSPKTKLEVLRLLHYERGAVNMHKTVTDWDIKTVRDLIFEPVSIDYNTDLTLYEFLLHTGYLTYLDRKSEWEWFVNIPNDELRIEFQYILVEVEAIQNKVKHDTIYTLNLQINIISEKLCEKTHFRKLICHFKKMFAKSPCSDSTTFQTTLVSIFEYKFGDTLRSDVFTRKKIGSPIYMTNEKGVTFIILAEVIVSTLRIKEQQVRNATTSMFYKIRDNRYIDNVKYPAINRVVFLVLVIGTQQNTTRNRLFGFGYSKNFGRKNKAITFIYVEKL